MISARFSLGQQDLSRNKAYKMSWVEDEGNVFFMHLETT
jgi:hypothetical protein